MMETDEVIQPEHKAEPWMNGAAIVLANGREVPITDSMVRQSLEKIAEPMDESAPRQSRYAS